MSKGQEECRVQEDQLDLQDPLEKMGFVVNEENKVQRVPLVPKDPQDQLEP